VPAGGKAENADTVRINFPRRSVGAGETQGTLSVE
jgi:hypothetical protein